RDKWCYSIGVSCVDGTSVVSKYKERHRLRRPMSFGAYEDERVVGIIARATSGFHEVNEPGAQVAFEDEFRAVEEREVSCKAQQGQSGVNRKLFGSRRNNMGNEPILALPKGSDNFVVMRGARSDLGVVIARPSTIWERANVVVDAWSRKGGVKPRRVRDICMMIQAEIRENIACVRNLVVVRILTFREAEIRESKMIGLELEQETTKVILDDDLDHMIDIMVNEVMIDENFTCSQVVTVKMIVRKFA
nr:hypothetical protein [Tanacetum cinerariifolium]